jgi:hypothetical protein
MAERDFVGGALRTTLSANIAANTTGMIDVVSGSTFPTGGTKPFVIALARGTATEEKLLINVRSGNTFDIASTNGRGYDGTTASAHPAGTTVDHVLDAIFLQHVNDSIVDLTQQVSAQVIKSETGTTYTAISSDLNKLVTLNNSSAITVTINTSLALSAGQRIDFVQLGTGQVTFSNSSVTLNGTPGLKLRARYSSATLICLSSDNYILVGDLSA